MSSYNRHICHFISYKITIGISRQRNNAVTELFGYSSFFNEGGEQFCIGLSIHIHHLNNRWLISGLWAVYTTECNVTPYFDNLFTSHCIINMVFYVSTVNTSSLLTETPNFTYSRPTSFYCGEGVMRRERERERGGDVWCNQIYFLSRTSFPGAIISEATFSGKKHPRKNWDFIYVFSLCIWDLNPMCELFIQLEQHEVSSSCSLW